MWLPGKKATIMIETASSINALSFNFIQATSIALLQVHYYTARILCRRFTPKRHKQLYASEELAQGPCVAARAGVEPTTLRTITVGSTNEPLRPTLLS